MISTIVLLHNFPFLEVAIALLRGSGELVTPSGAFPKAWKCCEKFFKNNFRLLAQNRKLFWFFLTFYNIFKAWGGLQQGSQAPQTIQRAT